MPHKDTKKTEKEKEEEKEEEERGAFYAKASFVVA